MGELALDGTLRAVRGVLPVAAEARSEGVRMAVVPRANGVEAAMVDGLAVYSVGSLREVVDLLSAENLPAPRPTNGTYWSSQKPLRDLADVKAQYQAKRALELAAAGGHKRTLLWTSGRRKDAARSLLALALASVELR